MNASTFRLLGLFLVGRMLLITSHALAQGTAVTYQGCLNMNGSPANGAYDFTFAGFNSKAGGGSIAGPVTNLSVVVSNGLFTTLFDFGSYSAAPTWLELAVRTNGANDFTVL